MNEVAHFVLAHQSVSSSGLILALQDLISMAEVCGLDVPPQSDSPVTVEVDATNAGDDGGPEQLTAVALYGDKTAEVTVEEQETKKYKLTFLPPTKDKYTLEMKWGENHIKGSPMHLDLRAPNAKAVTIAEPPAGKLKAGQEIKICFDTSKAGRGEMHSSCTGEEVGEINVDVQRRDFTNKFDVTFKPPHEDEYVVHVKWLERSIKGSPFKIDLIPVNPNKVKASAPKIPANPDDPIEMDVSTKGAGNAKLTATCMGTIGGKIPVSVKKVAAHDYHLTVKPPERDILSISVQYAGKHIPNSPFLVSTLPVDASKVKVTEPDNPEIGEPVSYKLNTLHAGAGSLTASCAGEKCGPVDIEIKQEGSTNNKYIATFTPNIGDVYTVGIKWGDDETPPKDVPGSPFTLPLYVPADATKVKAGDLHVPAEAGEDEWVWLDLDCSDAGHGEVTAKAGLEDGEQEIEVKIEQIDNKDEHYRVKFKSDQAGKYNLAVFYGGSPIPGSPYSDIEILDLSPKPDLVKHLQTKQPEQRGGTAELLFDAKDAGRGEFRARVAGLLTGQTPAPYELVPDSDHIYKVSFSPQLADTYLVDVYWEDHAVPDSPFYVEIVYPDEVIVTPPSEDSRNLKHPLHFDVDTSKAGPGKLTAHCEIRESGKEVETIITEDAEEPDKYTISVHPKEEGIYSVSIFFNEHHVKESPFDIDLVPKLVDECQDMALLKGEEVTIDVPKNQSSRPSSPEPLPTELQMFIGEPFSYVVGQENFEHLGSMTVSAVGEKTGPGVVVRKQNEEDLPCFVFDPDVADKYTVEIRINGALVAGNSFMVDYIYPIDASKCVIFGADGLNEKLPIDESVSFGVDASRAGNGKLSVNVDGPSSLDHTTKISVTSSEENPNVYHISYLPTARGTHKINLQWDGEPIPNSPVVLDVESSGDIPTFFLKDPLVVHFTTDCDPKQIESYAIHDDTCNRYTLKIGKRRHGRLKLILYAKEAGIHSVHILIGGKEINGSPYRVLFIETDPNACKVTEVPQEPPVGVETSFKVDAKKAGSGDLHIKAKVPHGGKTDVTHVAHKDGHYSIIFTPKVAGKHSFKVSWAGVEIPDSPVEMDVSPASQDLVDALQAASTVYVLKEDMHIFKKEFSISDEAVFSLYTKNAGKGQLTIRATGPCESRIKVVDQMDGTYGCTVQPKVSGRYLISILWNDFSIPGSPLQLNFTDGKSHMINGLKLETDYFSIGTPREYVIDCGVEKGVLKVNCHPSTSADVELTSIDGPHNTYLCKITPLIAGNHMIHVTYNDKHILDSPYVVQFYEADHRELEQLKKQRSAGEQENEEDDRLSSIGSLHLVGDDEEIEVPDVPISPKPAMVKAYGCGLKGGYAGQEGNFTIETAEAGDGKLEVNVRGAKESFKLNMRHHPDSDRTIMVRYDPKLAQNYTIDVKWSGTHIPGSPFEVNILEQRPLIYSFEL